MYSIVSELKNPDVIILPGTKNTMEDLLWLRESGMEAADSESSSSRNAVFLGSAAVIRCWEKH